MAILDGIRVLELSRTLAGPFSGHILADLGADVLKVEQPEIGDESRQFIPPSYHDVSCYFHAVNRNKRSITLNLKDSEDLETFYDLVDGADVVTESYRTGVAERLGVDYATLSARNPQLIYLSVSGYGRTGTRANWPAYDIVMQAETGLMSITGTADGEMVKIGPSVADITTGLYGGLGLLAALYERELSGYGQYLDVAMFDAQFGMLNNWLLAALASGEAPQPMGQGNPALAPYQIIAVADGGYMLGCANDQHWQRFCRGLGLEELLEDDRFSSNESRVRHRNQLIPLIEERTVGMTAARLDEAVKAVGVPGSKVNTLTDILESSFTAEREILQPLDDDASTMAVKFPVTFQRTPVQGYTSSPRLGEHTPRWL